MEVTSEPCLEDRVVHKVGRGPSRDQVALKPGCVVAGGGLSGVL